MNNAETLLKEINQSVKKTGYFTYSYKHAFLVGEISSDGMSVKFTSAQLLEYDLSSKQTISIKQDTFNGVHTVNVETTNIIINRIKFNNVRDDIVSFDQFQELVNYLNEPLSISDLNYISAIIRNRRTATRLITYYGYIIFGTYCTNNGMKDTFTITYIENCGSVGVVMPAYINRPMTIKELSPMFEHMRNYPKRTESEKEELNKSNKLSKPEKVDMQHVAEEIIQSIYGNDSQFIYHMNGYRFVGQVKSYQSNNISPDNITIHLTHVINPDLDMVSICTCKQTYKISDKLSKHQERCAKFEHTTVMTILSMLSSLFQDVFEQPKYVINLDNVFETEVKMDGALFEIAYKNYELDYTKTDTNTFGTFLKIFTPDKYGESYNIRLWNKKTVVVKDDLMVQTNDKTGVELYENLFIWILDQYVLKKIKTINDAKNNIKNMELQYEEHKKEVDTLQTQIDKLKKELVDVSSKMHQKKVMLDNYINLVNLVK